MFSVFGFQFSEKSAAHMFSFLPNTEHRTPKTMFLNKTLQFPKAGYPDRYLNEVL